MMTLKVIVAALGAGFLVSMYSGDFGADVILAIATCLFVVPCFPRKVWLSQRRAILQAMRREGFTLKLCACC
ncbi:hypothetical protein ABIC03_004376 [Bradyrhizobium sp. RT6a]|jgi:hypothetical protein